MANKIEFRIACLYFFLFAIAFLYGMGLIKKVYNYKEVDLAYTQKEIILEENALRLVLFDGFITMYHGNVQFTENSGLACFLTVKGVHYATPQALWKIEKISPVELFATVEWPGLPIRQIWHLLLEEGKLNWRIDLESKDDITISSIGVVFFFKNNYQEWISFYEQGRMPILEVLQQRKDVRPQITSNAFGLIASGKDARLFPIVGLNLKKGVFLNEALLSSCRDMHSRIPFSRISLGGEEPLRVFKNSKIPLSSGQIGLFDKKDDLLNHLIMR